MIHLEVSEDGEKYKLVDQLAQYVPVFKYIVKEFNEKALLAIVLIEDYWSPYRSVPEKERVALVCKDLLQNKTPAFLKNDAWKDACKKYNELQYDPILDQYRLYSEKILEINIFIKNTKVDKENVKDLQDLMAKNEKLNDIIIKLKEYIDQSQRRSILKQFGDITDYHNSK